MKPSARARLAASLAAFAFLGTAACGKKAPPRLPEEVTAARIPSFRAAVRDGEVHLDFAVPKKAVAFGGDERWNFARVLKKPDGNGRDRFEEAVAFLEKEGFEFGERLAWVDSGVIPGTVYAYQVEMRKKTRERALSDVVTATLVPPPAAPPALTAEGREGAVALSWEAPAGGGGDARFLVFRRRPPGGEAEPVTPRAIGDTRYIDTAVDFEVEYCYRVRAVVAAGGSESEGPLSEEVCGRSEDRTPPAAPGGLQVVAAGDAMILSWLPVLDADLFGYRVYRAEGDGAFRLMTDEPVRGLSWRDTAVGPGVRYRYRITAVDASRTRNESAFSPEAAAP